MIQIKPVEIPDKGIGTFFEIIALNFPMNPQQVSFYWELYTNLEKENCVMNGNLYMSQTVYEGWTNDDNYVINWALSELNFEAQK
jgi:hypothetical protein